MEALVAAMAVLLGSKQDLLSVSQADKVSLLSSTPTAQNHHAYWALPASHEAIRQGCLDPLRTQVKMQPSTWIRPG